MQTPGVHAVQYIHNVQAALCARLTALHCHDYNKVCLQVVRLGNYIPSEHGKAAETCSKAVTKLDTGNRLNCPELLQTTETRSGKWISLQVCGVASAGQYGHLKVRTWLRAILRMDWLANT